MVDAAIVMIENAHKHLERVELGKSRVDILSEAASEVGPALFFSLLIITVSFMPIFTLESQKGRLFSPLAFTKTFSMAAAALLRTVRPRGCDRFASLRRRAQSVVSCKLTFFAS
jgi:Cu(I)/Ag(I) efflux system membrane protein CusA/SilA